MNTALDTILPNWLMRCAENFPERMAVQCGTVHWSFQELDRAATRLARQLASSGVQKGSRVALLATNGLEFVTCVHALIYLGAILVPLNVRLTLEELCWQVRDVQASYLLHDAQHLEQATKIAQLTPGLTRTTLSITAEKQVHAQGWDEADVALHNLLQLQDIQAIMYTSGTTGTPKGVLITYGMQWWNAVGSALNLGHDPHDCWLLCLPLFHIGGLSILIRSVVNGISVIVQEKFDAGAVNEAIYRQGVTIISVVALMLQRMLSALAAEQEHGQCRQYPGTLRCVLLGGGPAPRSLLEACSERNIPVVQTYGLTESCSQAVTLSPADALRKLGSAGRPLLPVQLRIMHEDRLAAPLEPGMIYLKGPGITAGYDHQPAVTAQVIQDGWLATGDIGYQDAEGYLYVLDRRSDLIISGGENVYPAEIEACLLAHPAVAEAGVCAQEDAEWGQVPIAFVCLKAGQMSDGEELLAYTARHLARYKLPRAVYVVEQLPRNSSGKLLRRELPRLLAQST